MANTSFACRLYNLLRTVKFPSIDSNGQAINYVHVCASCWSSFRPIGKIISHVILQATFGSFCGVMKPKRIISAPNHLAFHNGVFLPTVSGFFDFQHFECIHFDTLAAFHTKTKCAWFNRDFVCEWKAPKTTEWRGKVKNNNEQKLFVINIWSLSTQTEVSFGWTTISMHLNALSFKFCWIIVY